MSYTIDNRWSPDAGIAPDNARAVYSARWIDNGYTFDVVPDRQGFAYDSPAQRDELIACLQAQKVREITNVERGEGWQLVNDYQDFRCKFRRFGGYVYVEAWLEAA